MHKKHAQVRGFIKPFLFSSALVGSFLSLIACLSLAAGHAPDPSGDQADTSTRAVNRAGDEGGAQNGDTSTGESTAPSHEPAPMPLREESIEQGVLVVRHGITVTTQSDDGVTEQAYLAALEAVERAERLARLEYFLSLTPLNREYVERRLTHTPLWKYEPKTDWKYRPTRFRPLGDQSTPPWTYQPKTSWTYHPKVYRNWGPDTTPPWTYHPQ